MTQPENEQRPRGLSANARIGLAVVAFGLVSVLLAVLGNGSQVPESLNIEPTNITRTLVAEAALAAPADVRWEFAELGRRKPVHDLIWFEDALLIASVDGLYTLDEEGEPVVVADFPAEVAPVRLWVVDNLLYAGLEDGRMTTYQAGQWADPVENALVFPPLFQVAPEPAIDPDIDLNSFCTPLGMVSSSDGVWIACPESVVHVSGATVTRYTSVDGLPDTPTGPLAEGPDGRMWIGLETGAAVIEELATD